MKKKNILLTTLLSLAMVVGLGSQAKAQTTFCFSFSYVTCTGGTVCIDERPAPGCCPDCELVPGCCIAIPTGTNTVCFDGVTPCVAPGTGPCLQYTFPTPGNDCVIYDVTVNSGCTNGASDTYMFTYYSGAWYWTFEYGDTFYNPFNYTPDNPVFGFYGDSPTTITVNDGGQTSDQGHYIGL